MRVNRRDGFITAACRKRKSNRARAETVKDNSKAARRRGHDTNQRYQVAGGAGSLDVGGENFRGVIFRA